MSSIEINKYKMDGVEYEVSYDYPPIYWKVHEKWGVRWGDGKVVMVYGNTIHQSFGEAMDEDLLVHEIVHIKQHAAYPGGPAAWWERYLDDQDFRLSQEIEAYRKQYEWSKEHLNSKTRKDILNHCAATLSSHLYGNMVTYEEAKKLITQNI